MTPAPVLFISHGAPTFAIEPGKLGPQLQTLGTRLTGVRAVLVVSPHWQTRDVQVMATPQPETVHDFGGFPARLYALRYPATGAPQWAAQAAERLLQAGFATHMDTQRGLDHGAWVPLLHLLPQAQIPVFQVSMPFSLTTTQAVALGRALAPLREQGVMIVGSGSMTHNLHEFRLSATNEAAYVREFAAWVRQAVLADAADTLADYRRLAPHAARAHPTEEHFLPLLIAVGANAGESAARTIADEITYGVLSMESYAWGLAD